MWACCCSLSVSHQLRLARGRSVLRVSPFARTSSLEPPRPPPSSHLLSSLALASTNRLVHPLPTPPAPTLVTRSNFGLRSSSSHIPRSHRLTHPSPEPSTMRSSPIHLLLCALLALFLAVEAKKTGKVLTTNEKQAAAIQVRLPFSRLCWARSRTLADVRSLSLQRPGRGGQAQAGQVQVHQRPDGPAPVLRRKGQPHLPDKGQDDPGDRLGLLQLQGPLAPPPVWQQEQVPLVGVGLGQDAKLRGRHVRLRVWQGRAKDDAREDKACVNRSFVMAAFNARD